MLNNSDAATLKEKELLALLVAERTLELQNELTERKRIEQELREKEFQYRNIADSGMAIIWTSGTDALCNYFNEPWLKFTGRTLEQELGNGWAEGVHPDDFDYCLKVYLEAFGKQEPFKMEYRLRHASGEYRWVLDMGAPNYNSSGEFIGYIGHCLDITNQKKIEEVLRENEEKYRLLYASMDQGLALHEIILDEDAKPVDFVFLDVNDSYTKLFGLTREMCIGKRIKEVMPKLEQYWIDIFGKVALTGEPNYYENFLETTQKYYSTYAYCTKKINLLFWLTILQSEN
ncbi:MAG: PAS domain S-box protein [Bacteroidota bacterium]